MNLIDSMKIFARVAELSSFTLAANDFGLPRASVSTAVQQLEAELGTRLLHRTTRKVQLTQDGQTFYERARDLLIDIDETQAMFQQGGDALQGRVRIDMSTGIARHAVIPRLPGLLLAHPSLNFELSCTERYVDLVREGFDCVLRGGSVTELGLIARPIGFMRMVNCASPAYLRACGMPASPDELAGHRLIHFVNTLGSKPGGFEHGDIKGERQHSVAMQGSITVNNAEAYTAACVAGMGIIQVPFVGVHDLIADGRLLELLPAHVARPMPLTLVYANRRNLPRRVRVVMDWLAEVIEGYLRDHQ